MNKKIFCSIIMPVHNGERYLRDAIESVLNQTYTNYEFLIIENCSTDSSLEIIKSFDDPRIKLIIEKDCGIVQGYNRGFKEAKGRYILIHDQDDLSDETRLEKLLGYLLKNKLDLCGSYFNIIDSHNNIIERKKNPIEDWQISFELFFYRMAIFNPTVLINKSVFEKYGFFKKEYPYDFDYEFYLRIEDSVIKGNYPEFLYSWRYWKSSTSYKVREAADKSSFNLAMNELEVKKEKYLQHYNLLKGCIYYYNNQLFKSLKYLLADNYQENYYKTIKRRYLFLILFGNIITKTVRAFGLYNLKIFIFLKKILNKKYPRYR